MSSVIEFMFDLLPARFFIRTFCWLLNSPDHIITHEGCRALVSGLLVPNPHLLVVAPFAVQKWVPATWLSVVF